METVRGLNLHLMRTWEPSVCPPVRTPGTQYPPHQHPYRAFRNKMAALIPISAIVIYIFTRMSIFLLGQTRNTIYYNEEYASLN